MDDPLAPCRVCPRECGVDRRAGETGFCGLDDALHVAWAGPHFGEEPCLSGTRGVGNVFFSGCNLACVYCQNHQISHQRVGDRVMDREEFADLALDLEARGVHFLGLVTPSPQAPLVREALAHAKSRGLSLPVVYNTSAYDSVERLRAFDGLVDVYLPDLKYAEDAKAARYSGVEDYVGPARNAVLEMYRQAGDMEFDPETGLARRGVWARHLVLPGGIAGTWETLCFLAFELSTRIGLSVMAQYSPLCEAADYPELARSLEPEEYEEAVAMARDLGFVHLLCQDLRDAPDNAVPDFSDEDRPFRRF